MKKILSKLIFISISSLLFAFQSLYNSENYGEYTLENGMQVFTLEDFSTAFVRIEYTVHAGISSQEKDNTGYFPLYTRLFKKQNNSTLLKNLKAECNSENSRYIITVSTAMLEETMEELSRHAFAPVFTDEAILKEYNQLKNEVIQFAETPASFINTSIDSRVYAESPWKQDSGIYPELFKKASVPQIRSILTSIARSWYTPQNSAVFISGNISKEAAYTLTQRTFGSYSPASKPRFLQPVKAGGKAHKFIMYDPEFSSDLTQIVIQYTSLDMNQANLAAATFNSDYSSLKRTLCNEHLLNIRGPEYINVSSVHKNGSSRLIYQSLLEQNKRTPVEQAESFIQAVSKSAEITIPQEYLLAKEYIRKNFLSVTGSSVTFMENLSRTWSLDSVTTNYAGDDAQLLADKLYNRPDEIASINPETIRNQISSETPFIFVLVNSKTFNKYKADFKRLGYEEITQKNGPWYSQKLFHNTDTHNEETEFTGEKTRLENSVKKFLDDTLSSVSTFTLKNNIPVTVKTNRTTSNVVIMLSIEGGKLSDGTKPGFANVMANALATNIQKEIDKYKIQKLLNGYTEVLAETNAASSLISVECTKEDIGLCIKSISDALIFGEITPAEADSYVYSVQTQKRLSNASPVNQMNFRASRYFWDSKVIRNVFDADNDILNKTRYTDILASYPKLLDAKLYKIFIAGNTDTEAVRYILDDGLGILIPQTSEITKEKVPEPDFPQKPRKLSMKIRHLFYTDVKAEDAGPMPAILVPTKNFEDPVQFWFKSPARKSFDSVLFDALLFYLNDSLENNGADTKLFSPTQEFNCAGISFLSVEHTNEIDLIYQKTLENLLSELKNEDDSSVTRTITNLWILNKLSDSSTNRGNAKLLCLEDRKENSFIQEYSFINNAKKEDFLKIAEEYFPQEPLLKIYSNDAKK